MIAISSPALTAEISPKGAELSRLTDATGRELLWDGDPAIWSGRAPILFPIVGMVAGGTYRLDGRRYALPKHGFARHADFAVAERSPDAVTFRLTDSDETRAIYPFAFILDIRFAVHDATLTMAATVRNTGDVPLPASFGFHPAFRWPLPYGEPRANHRITFASAEPAPVRRIDADGLLTPDAHPTPVDGDTLILRDDLFVDDALIFDRLSSRSLTYGAGQGPHLAIAFDDLPELGIWTKPGSGYICIEPWQGYADPAAFAGDFRDKPGIVEIAPRAERGFTMRVALVA